MLKQAKKREEQPSAEEGDALKMNDLSVEEVAERRGDLRKMRELMFRAEIKSRRVSKIKSKTYRRLRRKERERLGEKIDEKDDEDDSETEAGRMKRELDRARERATLKHKHTGKWARQMKGRPDLDQDSRRDIEDMLSRGEKLRQRIQGKKSDESEDESEGQESEDGEDGGLDGTQAIAKIKQGAFNELAKLEQGIQELDGPKTGKGVFEMKFMKDAMARQAAATNKEVDDFVKEFGTDAVNQVDEEDGPADDPQCSAGGVVAVRAGGRVVYRPGTAVG